MEEVLNDAVPDHSASDEVVSNTINSSSGSELPKISKNQQKRILKEAKRKETKAEWRKLQKSKRKLKEQLKREEFAAKGLLLII